MQHDNLQRNNIFHMLKTGFQYWLINLSIEKTRELKLPKIRVNKPSYCTVPRIWMLSWKPHRLNNNINYINTQSSLPMLTWYVMILMLIQHNNSHNMYLSANKHQIIFKNLKNRQNFLNQGNDAGHGHCGSMTEHKN